MRKMQQRVQLRGAKSTQLLRIRVAPIAMLEAAVAQHGMIWGMALNVCMA
jgi:hypothetical protein